MAAEQHEVLRTLDFDADLEGVRSIANAAFRSSRPGDMITEYPTLVSASNADNCLVILQDGVVVSHVGCAYRTTVWGSFTCLAAEIGCVVTCPTARTGGLATRLMHEAISRARAKGAAIMFISGTRSLYTRLGAVECGRFPQATVALSDLQPESSSRVAVSTANIATVRAGTLTRACSADLPAIERLRSGAGYRFVIPQEELQLLLDAQFAGNLTAQWWVWRPSDKQQPALWLVVNDLTDDKKNTLRIVEAAGLIELLPALALSLRDVAYPHCQAIEYEAVVPSQMPAQWLVDAAVGPLRGTVLLLDVDSFVSAAVRPICPAKLAFSCSNEHHSVTCTLTLADQGTQTRTFVGPQVERLLFNGDLGDQSSSTEKLDTALTSLLPFPLLRYGLSFI